MTAATPLHTHAAPRDGFAPGRWQEHVDVRDFIQRALTSDGPARILTPRRTA